MMLRSGVSGLDYIHVPAKHNRAADEQCLEKMFLRNMLRFFHKIFFDFFHKHAFEHGWAVVKRRIKFYVLFCFEKQLRFYRQLKLVVLSHPFFTCRFSSSVLNERV